MTARNAFGDLATEAQQQSIVTALGSLLTELQTKFEAGQQVALDAASLTALESINAAVSGAVTVSGTVGLDANSLAALETINANVTGTVGLTNGTTVALDATSLSALETVNASVSGTVSLTNGTTVALDAGSLSALETVNANVTGTVGLAPGTTVGIDGGSVEVTLADTTVSLSAGSLAALESVTVGGSVELDAGSLAALESITATLSGPVALDSATLTALEAITATLSGTVTVTGTVELGATSLAALEHTTPQVAGSDVSSGNPMPVAQQGTVDVSDRSARAVGKAGIQVAGADVASGNPVPVAQQGTVDISNRDTRQLGLVSVVANGETVTSDYPMPVEFAAAQGVIADVQKATPRIVSASGSALNAEICPSTEVLGRSVSIQVTGTFSATYTFQASNDATNWRSVILQRIDVAANATNDTVANYIYRGNVPSRYFRCILSSYTSGTATGIALFSPNSDAANMPTTTAGDAIAGQQTLDVNTRNLAFNGSTYDRLRSGAQSAVTGRLSIVSGTSVTQALSAVAVTGASATTDYGAAHSKHSMQVVLTGSPTVVTVALEASLNGSQWMTAATWSTGAGQASGDIVFTSDKPVRYVRANLTTLTGGTSPTVSAYLTAVST